MFWQSGWIIQETGGGRVWCEWGLGSWGPKVFWEKQKAREQLAVVSALEGETDYYIRRATRKEIEDATEQTNRK